MNDSEQQLRDRIAALEAENASLKTSLAKHKDQYLQIVWQLHMLDIMTQEASVILFVMDAAGRLLLYRGKGTPNIDEDKQADAIGKSVFDIYKKADGAHAEFLDLCSNALKGDYCRKVVERGNADGFFDIIFSPVKNDNGQVIYVIGVSNDVTKIVLMERALAKNEEKYYHMAENSRDMMYRFSIDGFYDYVSPSSVAITGYSPDEWYADHRLLKKIIHPAFLNGVREAWLNLKKGIVLPSYEYQIYHKSGELRWVRQRNLLVTNEKDEPIGVDGDITDITELKRSELRLQRVMKKLQRSNADLDEFATAASHDLQEPLMVITNFTRILMDDYAGKLDAKGGDFLKYVFDAADRMRGLLNGLLEYSRITATKHYRREVPAREVVKAAIDSISVSAERRGAKITVDVADGAIYCDPYQITRALVNIISNSLKFCDKSVPEINISARKEERSWQFTVNDNGIGIEQENLKKIFQIFNRGSHEMDGYTGTGVGLAMVRKIAERHGGSVAAESSVGKGSSFTLLLPESKRQSISI